MSISEENSKISLSIRKLYLMTCEGEFCAPVETVSDLEVLVKKGHIMVSECRSDPRSKHGAATCKVKLTWLTDRGKEAAKKATERFDESLKELNRLLENINPRISVLAKYLLARWATSILAYKDGDRKRRTGYRRGWNMLPPFEWDINVPGTFVSVLPDGVKNELQSISGKLVELGLAEWNRLGHNVQGWYDSKTLMTTKPVACAMLRDYGGFKMPFAVEPLISSTSKAYQEAELARELEHNNRIFIESIVDYLNYGSYHDLIEFLKTIESLQVHGHSIASVNWDLIEKYAKPEIRYVPVNRDEMDREAVSRRLYGIIPSIYATIGLRHELVLESVKKALATWFDTGTLCLEEVPPIRKIWDFSEREANKRVESHLKGLPKLFPLRE